MERGVCLEAFCIHITVNGASHVPLAVKEHICQWKRRAMGSIPGSGRSPGGGHGNPLQHSHLENLMHRGAWQPTVHRVTQSQTALKRLSMHTLRTVNIFVNNYIYVLYIFINNHMCCMCVCVHACACLCA